MILAGRHCGANAAFYQLTGKKNNVQMEYLLVFVIVFTLDSITPGPAVVLVMSRGASIGLSRTLPLIAGLVIGDLILFLLALTGLAALAASLGPYFFIIKWLGIFYLLFLAMQMWNRGSDGGDHVDLKYEGWRSLWMGVILPIGNPKAVGFYAALLPAVMNVAELTVLTAIQFATAIVVIWGGVLAAYTGVAAYSRRHYSGSSVQKWLNRGSAGALIGVAGVMAIRD